MEANLEVQKLNPQHELSSEMETKDKMDVDLLDSKEIIDNMNPDSSFVSRLTEVEDLMKMHKSNGKPAANEKYDQDENQDLLCSDTILEGVDTLVSFNDPAEYPFLGTLTQSQVSEKSSRKLKRATSVSPSQRTRKKKQNSRVSPPVIKESI